VPTLPGLRLPIPDDIRPWLTAAVRDHPATRLLVVATMPRSGSELLCAALTDTGVAGEPREYLNLEAVRVANTNVGLPKLARGALLREIPWMIRGHRPRATHWPDPQSVLEYLWFLHARTSTPNGVVATKLFWPGFERMFLRAGVNLDELGMPVTFVRLGRRDLVAQAVSLSIARQTRQWGPHMPRKADPVYDLADLRDAFANVEAGAKGWDRWFAEHAPDTPVVVQEEMVTDLQGAVRTILAEIGEELRVEITPAQQKVGGRQNAEWIERFLAEAPELAERRWWNPPS
jgi:LPS sulfotransferase NodH